MSLLSSSPRAITSTEPADRTVATPTMAMMVNGLALAGQEGQHQIRRRQPIQGHPNDAPQPLDVPIRWREACRVHHSFHKPKPAHSPDSSFDGLHGLHEALPGLQGVWIEAVHILEQLPGVIFDDIQDVQQALVPLGVDVLRLGADPG